MSVGLFQAVQPQEESAGPRPLADRMRPRTLDELVGQEDLLAPGKPLRLQIERDDIGSMLFWGPPGCGKTTLARIIATHTRSEFIPFSAVTSGIKEIKLVMTEAGRARDYGRRTVVFVDEVHRFNKAQQDAFLPHVESGSITLIGATTENPSFEVISPLLSRMKVYILHALTTEQIAGLLQRAITDPERGLGKEKIAASAGILERIAIVANGDARAAYNTLEALVRGAAPDAEGRLVLTTALLEDVLQKKLLPYDKAGEEHYNLISALHKSVRNSDPNALRMTLAAKEAFEFIGPPEGFLALGQAAVYLALAPKSNALYTAYGAVQQDLERTVAEPVPLHLRNAVTGLMRHVGYGEGYQYAHEFEEKVTDMQCLPDSLAGRTYYHPTHEGFEARVQERLAQLRKIQKKPAGTAQNASNSGKPDEEKSDHEKK